MIGVYVAAGVSGAHLNPAVTMALAVRAGSPGARCAVHRPRSSPAPSWRRPSSTPPITRRSTTSTAACGRYRARSAPPASSRRTPSRSCRVPRRLRRSGRRHGAAHGRDLRDHRSAERSRRRRARAGPGRPARRADRRDLRLQRRLRDQPGARLRPAAVHGGGRLGWRGLHRRRRLVVGADCRRHCIGGVVGA